MKAYQVDVKECSVVEFEVIRNERDCYIDSDGDKVSVSNGSLRVVRTMAKAYNLVRKAIKHDIAMLNESLVQLATVMACIDEAEKEGNWKEKNTHVKG